MKQLLFLAAFFAVVNGFAKLSSEDEAKLHRLRTEGKRKGWTFEVGMTPISNLPVEKYTGLRVPKNWKEMAPWVVPTVQQELPTKWDWRDQNVVTEIRDQALPQYCGSCWAFGTVAALESAILIKTGRKLHIAEQQLVSCQPSYGTCSGGYFAFGFYMKKGANYESDFPYQADDVACKTSAPQHEKVKSWAYVGNSSGGATVAQMKQAIYEHGPIAVTVSASGNWKYYKSGVYNDCNRNGTNHIVALVGWNDEEQAWILKNSHGTQWGEEGFMRIKYTDSRGYKCNNVGASAAFVVFE